MDLVVDANILFSALITDSVTSELMFEETLHLYAPEFIFVEFEKHKELIVSKTRRTPSEFDQALSIMRSRIRIIPLSELTPFLPEASKISPDEKDISYFALALKLNIAIWSNDKAMKEKQIAIKVYSTNDIFQIVK